MKDLLIRLGYGSGYPRTTFNLIVSTLFFLAILFLNLYIQIHFQEWGIRLFSATVLLSAELWLTYLNFRLGEKTMIILWLANAAITVANIVGIFTASIIPAIIVIIIGAFIVFWFIVTLIRIW